jgi:ABC-type glycerol-3-phosphate transport system permease component
MYTVLVAVALVVLFPFFIAFTTSLKQSDDVFNYPPTVLPRKAAVVSGGALDGKPLFDLRGGGRDPAGGARDRRRQRAGARRPGRHHADGARPGRRRRADRRDRGGRRSAAAARDRGGRGRAADAGPAAQRRRRVFRDPADPELLRRAQRLGRRPGQGADRQPSNYSRVLELQRLDRSLTNTLLVTVLVVVGQVVTSILAATPSAG